MPAKVSLKRNHLDTTYERKIAAYVCIPIPQDTHYGTSDKYTLRGTTQFMDDFLELIRDLLIDSGIPELHKAERFIDVRRLNIESEDIIPDHTTKAFKRRSDMNRELTRKPPAWSKEL